jgi:hypothetical protein
MKLKFTLHNKTLLTYNHETIAGILLKKKRPHFNRKNLARLQSHLKRNWNEPYLLSPVRIWYFNCNPVLFLPQKSADNGLYIWAEEPNQTKYTHKYTHGIQTALPTAQSWQHLSFYYWCLITIRRTLSSLFLFTIISRFIALLLLWVFSLHSRNNRELKTGPALSRCVHIVKRPGTSTTEHQTRPKMMQVSLENLLEITHRTAGISQLVYCGLDATGIWGLLPGMSKRFLCPPKSVQIGSWVQPASCSKFTAGFSYVDRASRALRWSPPPSAVGRGVTPPRPQMA